MTENADKYFEFGPVKPDEYKKSRGKFDGILGFFDGLGSTVNSFSRTTGSLADASENVSRGIGVHDDRQLDRQERELDMQLKMLTTKRGDNTKLYLTAGAAAVALIVIMK